MPMPLTYDNAYASQKEVFSRVFPLANPTGDPDPEFDLQGHAEMRWGPHSWRRAGEKVARDSADVHKMSHIEVDLYSGWDLYEHSRDMHYAGQQREHRVKRCAITAQF